MRVGIVTDSTAYLPESWLAEHGVEVVPLSIVIDMDTYVDGVDRPVGEVARALTRAGGATTSRPSPQQFLTRYERLADAGATQILSVHLSAALSGTGEAAALAAASSPVPVLVVDSASMGAGLGYAVREAVDYVRRAGPDATAEGAAGAASGVARETAVLFCVASLEFLRRGGRIGAASAFLGSALAVKPLLALQDGRIEPVEKQRTMGRAVGRLIELAVDRVSQRPGSRVTVHHVGAQDRARQIAAATWERAEGALGEEPVIVELGLVAAAHLGPGSLGVVIAPPPVA